MEDTFLITQIPVDSLEKLFDLGGVYVDKTGYLLELVKSYGPFFLSRPRRFGKSLLLDTIRQIFEGRKDLFSGLKIDELAPNYSWETFPVIQINMNDTDSDPEKFNASLLFLLELIAQSYDLKLNRDSVVSAITGLITHLSMKFQTTKTGVDGRIIADKSKVVLLIDEYDFPLLKHLHAPEKIEKIRLMLYDFYSAVKGCSSLLRFVFITGITKFKQLSLFSALNNIVDISFSEKFSRICGFTKDEIELSYGKYLEKIVSDKIDNGEMPACSKTKDLMDKIKEWYDGYSWDGKTKVYNPFSIKYFFGTQKYRNYWYGSGTPLFSTILDSFDGTSFTLFGTNISLKSPLEIQDTDRINSEAFLLHAGYLTVDSILEEEGCDTYRLKIPNNEIKNAINLELSAKFQSFVASLEFMKNTKDPLKEFTSMKDRLLSALWSCDIRQSERLLGSIFSGIPREWYRNGGEGNYKLILLTLMRFGGAVFTGNMLEALGETFSDAGRSDLLFDVSGNGYIVIELKYVKALDKDGKTDGQGVHTTDQYVPVGTDSPDEGRQPVSLSGFTRLLKYGKVSDLVKRKLENMVDEAFRQILDKDYAKQFLVSEMAVRAVAIAIYDTSTVMVRFAEVVWDADEEGELDFRKIPVPSQNDQRHDP
ncbi:MAG: AAA family ATPase [Deltaproteobacteria bacterium]|jgi:hypothetical protein|nr:AAA family ATPase [Deltaproteobacteria bacterium]